jgi:hypothetical protein
VRFSSAARAGEPAGHHRGCAARIGAHLIGVQGLAGLHFGLDFFDATQALAGVAQALLQKLVRGAAGGMLAVGLYWLLGARHRAAAWASTGSA